MLPTLSSMLIACPAAGILVCALPWILQGSVCGIPERRAQIRRIGRRKCRPVNRQAILLA